MKTSNVSTLFQSRNKNRSTSHIYWFIITTSHLLYLIYLQFAHFLYKSQEQPIPQLFNKNTLSYIQSLNGFRSFSPYFVLLVVWNKLKAQAVSKVPIDKGNKWTCGSVRMDQWKISTDPLVPAAHLSPTTVYWWISPSPCSLIYGQKKNKMSQWNGLLIKLLERFSANKSWSLHSGCWLLSHSGNINKRATWTWQLINNFIIFWGSFEKQ